MNKFKVIITSYNNENWTEICINSLITQTFTNYEVLFFDDCSTDKTFEIANKNSDKRFTFTKLSENRTKSFIFTNLVDSKIDDNDIVLFLDGDDWLSSDEVLNAINQYYELNDPWVAYGGMVVWNGGDQITEPYPQNSEFSIETLKNRGFRKDMWRSSHVKTMRGFIWKSIDKTHFLSKRDNRLILRLLHTLLYYYNLQFFGKHKLCFLMIPHNICLLGIY